MTTPELLLSLLLWLLWLGAIPAIGASARAWDSSPFTESVSCWSCYIAVCLSVLV